MFEFGYHWQAYGRFGWAPLGAMALGLGGWWAFAFCATAWVSSVIFFIGKGGRMERYTHLHQVNGPLFVWPDRFDNTKSGWCHMVSLYIELALAEIMATDLPTYIGGYHFDITWPFLAILTTTWSNLINAMQNLGVSYNYLYSAYIYMSKWWYLASHYHFSKHCCENRHTHSASTHHLNKMQKIGCVLSILT